MAKYIKESPLKTICKTNRSGYEHKLVIGQEYEVLDIQDGIFSGDYYVKVQLPEDAYHRTPEGRICKTAVTHLHRFDISKEDAEAYVKEHWRDGMSRYAYDKKHKLYPYN